jgi:uncharacterized protein (TIGR02145 family)
MKYMPMCFVCVFLFLLGCSKDSTGSKSLPSLETLEVTEITSNTAHCGGNIKSEGGSAIISCGVCWSTDPSPSTNDDKTNDNNNAGSFTSNITDLISATQYYIRAYATNSDGIGYGNIISFNTEYLSVTIGSQIWMAENLKVTHYRNGDAIPDQTKSSVWTTLDTGAMCIYGNGNLYNWYAVNDSRGLAPEGWHISTDEEWKELEMYLGMSQTEADKAGFRGTNEGGKLKEAGTDHWNTPNVRATNETGFTALPGGYRNGLNGSFGYPYSYGYWWSSTEYDTDNAWFRLLRYINSDVHRNFSLKKDGLSVRCVKD